MEMLITLIVYVLVIGLLWWLLNYILGLGLIPQPLANVVRIIAVVILVLIAIYILLGFAGGAGSMSFPHWRC